jgi:hypothetical protein
LEVGLRAEVPFPLSRPDDEQARAAGYENAEDWYSKSAAASLIGPAVAKVEYQMLPPPCRDDEDVVFDPLRFAGRGLAEDLQEPTAESSRLAAAVERAVGEAMGLDRPYLLLDVEPRMVQRADYCLLHRERLARIAKAEWEEAPCLYRTLILFVLCTLKPGQSSQVDSCFVFRDSFWDRFEDRFLDRFSRI